jgi:hypothetical protein
MAPATTGSQALEHAPIPAVAGAEPELEIDPPVSGVETETEPEVDAFALAAGAEPELDIDPPAHDERGNAIMVRNETRAIEAGKIRRIFIKLAP